jgi:prepilin peptidase CpaA
MHASAPQAVVLAVLVVSMGAATIADVARRRIPNWLSLATAAAGLGLSAAGATGITLWSSMAGVTIGLALMLPGHLLGATGAGDVKLFAAAGAVLGAAQTFEAFLYVALAGGLLALAFACARGRLSATVAATFRLFGGPAGARAAIESPDRNNRFPYGPAIAVGCLCAALI